MNLAPNIAVFGSSGKMGSGIAELFMQTFPFQQDRNWSIALIDNNETALFLSKSRIRDYLRSFGEKNINQLRRLSVEYTKLISNKEIIDNFVESTFDHLTFSTNMEIAKNAQWIFEAIHEDIDEKVKLFKELNHFVPNSALFFSNTSAIPIHLLEEKSGLKQRILGFHFYNPPTHNTMLEIVAAPHLKSLAFNLAEVLKRDYVESADVPGFIGNGFFIRELAFALKLVQERQASFAEIDAITEQLLLRPMGIFKLARFIGLQTTMAIAKIMGIDCSYLSYLPQDLEKIAFDVPNYKEFKKHPDRISPFFERLDHPLALDFLANGVKIAKLLVETKVAAKLSDVNKVLTVGFQYLYEL